MAPGTAPLRVLMAHSHYRQRGGEDVVFEAERDLLRDHGHDVDEFVRDNADVRVETRTRRLRAAASTVWARETGSHLAERINRFRPDIVHVHNTFTQLSPVVARVCRQAGVPVVQTLHNYRFGCAAATLFRDGAPCEDCVGRRVGWPGVAHACYRGSRAESAVIATMNALHRGLGTWSDVSRYLAPTQFARDRLVAIGLPPERVAVKPHFVTPDPGMGRPGTERGFVLFVGRLTEEKGVRVLLAAAARASDVPVRVVGDGPLATEVRRAALPNVTLLGPRPHREILEMMGAARSVVVPSVWYETFGLVVIESYARGTPVIVSDIGALGELVDEDTGVRVAPGDPVALAAALQEAWTSAEAADARGRAARQRYVERYTAAAGYAALHRVYDDVLDEHRATDQ